jgi:hypothetical protein
MATDATLVETNDTPDHDTLVPDPQVQKEFGVSAMSIWRWDRGSSWDGRRRLGLGAENSAAGSRLRISSASWLEGPSSNGCGHERLRPKSRSYMAVFEQDKSPSPESAQAEWDTRELLSAFLHTGKGEFHA